MTRPENTTAVPNPDSQKSLEWWKHPSNLRDDKRVRRVIARYGMSGYGRLHCLLEILADAGGSLPRNEDTITDLRFELDAGEGDEMEVWLSDCARFGAISLTETISSDILANSIESARRSSKNGSMGGRPKTRTETNGETREEPDPKPSGKPEPEPGREPTPKPASEPAPKGSRVLSSSSDPKDLGSQDPSSSPPTPPSPGSEFELVGAYDTPEVRKALAAWAGKLKAQTGRVLDQFQIDALCSRYHSAGELIDALVYTCSRSKASNVIDPPSAQEPQRASAPAKPEPPKYKPAETGPLPKPPKVSPEAEAKFKAKLAGLVRRTAASMPEVA